MFSEVITVYVENYAKPTRMLCGKSVDFVNITADGTHIYLSISEC
jgi:hypothetical protein